MDVYIRKTMKHYEKIIVKKDREAMQLRADLERAKMSSPKKAAHVIAKKIKGSRP